MSTITIIGIGSPVAGDTAGMEAVEYLRKLAVVLSGVGPVHWLVRERPGLTLLSDWRGTSTVVLIDTLDDTGEVGTVVRIDAKALLEQAKPISSHHLGVAEALALAAELGELPPQVLIYGIACGSNKSVATWLPRLAAMLSHDLNRVIGFPGVGEEKG